MQFKFQLVLQRLNKIHYKKISLRMSLYGSSNQVAGDMLNAAVSSHNFQWFQISLQSLEKVEPTSTACVTLCNFLCNFTAMALPIFGNHFKGEVAFTHVSVVVTKGSYCLVSCSIWDDCRSNCLTQLPLFQFAKSIVIRCPPGSSLPESRLVLTYDDLCSLPF